MGTTMIHPRVLDARIDEEGAAVATVEVPVGCTFFDGHFPGEPILPGVAQLWIVARVWEAATGRRARLAAVRRMKFTSRIGPGAVVEVRVAPVAPGGRCAFSLKDARNDFSSGELTLASEVP